jgi:hypothetical protein
VSTATETAAAREATRAARTRAARTRADTKLNEEVVDLDVECCDEGVELGFHKPLLGVLSFLVTANFPSVANSEAII